MAQALGLQAQSSAAGQYAQNISTLQNRSTLVGNALQQLKTITDRVNELATQSDGVSSPDQLKANASETGWAAGPTGTGCILSRETSCDWFLSNTSLMGHAVCPVDSLSRFSVAGLSLSAPVGIPVACSNNACLPLGSAR